MNKEIDYNSLLKEFKNIEIETQDYTFMELIGKPHYENACSNFFAFYLQPENVHGLGDLVLRALIETIPNLDISSQSDSIEVIREYNTLKGNRLDILITSKDWIIGIENKIYHTLKNDLKDYNNTIQSLGNSSNRPLVNIVLSLDKLYDNNDLIKMNDNGFVNIVYQDFIRNLNEGLAEYTTQNGLNKYVVYLNDYIENLNKLINRNMYNKELTSFFDSNADKVEHLISEYETYKKSFANKINKLETLLSEEYKNLHANQWIYKKSCLVHDYNLNGKKIAVDVFYTHNGFEISIVGRNKESNSFIKEERFTNLFSDEKYKSSMENNRRMLLTYTVETDIKSVVIGLKEILEKLDGLYISLSSNV